MLSGSSLSGQESMFAARFARSSAPAEVEWLYWKAMIRTSRPIPLKKIKLIIFDLDGTLIDSELDLAASVNAMLRHYGRKELPLEVIGTYIGDGAPMLIRRALGDPADRRVSCRRRSTISCSTTASTSSTTRARYDGIKEALQQIGATRRRTAQAGRAHQ